MFTVLFRLCPQTNKQTNKPSVMYIEQPGPEKIKHIILIFDIIYNYNKKESSKLGVGNCAYWRARSASSGAIPFFEFFLVCIVLISILGTLACLKIIFPFRCDPLLPGRHSSAERSSLPKRHVCCASLRRNCFTLGRFHSWLRGGILAHPNGDVNHMGCQPRTVAIVNSSRVGKCANSSGQQ